MDLVKGSMMSPRTRVFLLLFLGPPVLLAVAILLLAVPLPHPFPARLSRGRNTIAAVATGLLGAAWLVRLAWSVVSAFRRAGRAFEPELVSLGLDPQPWMGFGRRYRGRVRGHALDVEFMPARTLRPCLLGISVAAPTGVEMFIGTQSPPVGGIGRQRVQTDGEAFGDLQVFAAESPRAQRLLDEPSLDIIGRLLARQREDGLRELHVWPDRLYLRSHPSPQVAGKRVREWLEHLLALADGWSAPRKGGRC
jgi:hypothetical protein